VSAAIEAPFARYQGVVRPEWIDGNGHMNLAWYIALFDWATDAVFEAAGFGEAYRLASNCGPFAAESHVLYERELLAGECVRVSTLLLASDAKRLHLAHEMVRAADGQRAATQELLYLHVDLAVRRVVPFPPDLQARLAAAVAAHAAVAAPEWVGRRVGMTRG
jgi:acyl-CoA thioester hydrolase